MNRGSLFLNDTIEQLLRRHLKPDSDTLFLCFVFNNLVDTLTGKTHTVDEGVFLSVCRSQHNFYFFFVFCTSALEL